MLVTRKQSTQIFADRVTGQWVLRDREGHFWVIPPAADPWESRQPFTPTVDTVLEPVPGHYKGLLGLYYLDR